MGILITDFDGTVTRYDFFDRVHKRWPFPPQDDPWENFVEGEITHFQTLAEIFACIRTTEADLMELADSTGVSKVAIVRDALNRSDSVAFAGDGRPDLRPALLVQPRLRFARGWLAEALSERWSQIADQVQKTQC